MAIDDGLQLAEQIVQGVTSGAARDAQARVNMRRRRKSRRMGGSNERLQFDLTLNTVVNPTAVNVGDEVVGDARTPERRATVIAWDDISAMTVQMTHYDVFASGEGLSFSTFTANVT